MDWLGFLKAPFVRLTADAVPFNPSRRAFIGGAAAVVAAASLMPVRAPTLITDPEAVAVWLDGHLVHDGVMYTRAAAELNEVIRRAFIPRLFVQVYKQSPLQLLFDNTEFIGGSTWPRNQPNPLRRRPSRSGWSGARSSSSTAVPSSGTAWCVGS